MRYYFMTSYASAQDRVWVAQFHEDLERELRIRVGTSVGGHLGSRVVGERPAPVPARRAAASAPTMVALCSDLYFQDRECGRDWAVFAEREKDHGRRHEPAAAFLIPIVWRPLHAPLPPAVAESQSLSAARAEPFADVGLRDLLRMHDKRYRPIVEATAAAVIDAYLGHLQSLDDVEAEQIPPAFGADSPPDGSSAAPPATNPVAKRVEPRPVEPRRRPVVVISYVGPDEPWAEWIAALLERKGYKAKKVPLYHGQSGKLDELIKRARSEADWAVAVLSKNYFDLLPGESVDWQGALADYGGEKKGGLLRVRIDPTPLPASVRGMRDVDISDPRSDRETRLLEAVPTMA